MLAGDATSNPSSPSATSAAASASCRARRGSAIMAGPEIADQALESQPIALRAEPRHHADRAVRQHRAAALRVSSEDVRQVHLNERHTHRDERGAARGPPAPPAVPASAPPRDGGAPKNWSNENPPVCVGAGAGGAGAAGGAAADGTGEAWG